MRISENKLRRLIRSVLSEVMSRSGTSVYDFLKTEDVPDISPKHIKKFSAILRKYKSCIPPAEIKLAYEAFQQGDRRSVESALSPYIDKCVRKEFDAAEEGMAKAFGNRPDDHNIIFPDDGIERKQKQKTSPDIFSLDKL
jgi:hypothetical protein